MARSEPTNAAATCAHNGIPDIYFSRKIIVIATNIFAPDEIPSTNGPAIGFLKNVCNKNPDNDNAPPKIAAIHRRGRRIFQIILYSGVPISPCRKIMRKIRAGDI